MRIRKIMAAVAASVIGASVLTISAGAYDTFLMYADGDWSAQSMDAAAYPDGHCDVTADGTYTVSVSGMTTLNEETGEDVPAIAEGATVFCVDIEGLAAAKNAGKDAPGYDDCQTGADKMAFAKAAGINITDVSIKTKSTDGTEKDIAVDQGKYLFGDIEGNGKIRLEIYNEYGDSKNDPPVNTSDIYFDDVMSVTFTISGVSEAAAPEATTPDATTPAATPDKGSPDTGVEGIAVVGGVAVLAAGALFVAKKRK